MMIYIVTLCCVIGIAFGQLLFKMGAMALSKSDSILSLKPAFILLTAMCLYGLTSCLWVWVLQRIELGRIYPLMALAFVFVPLASYFMFGEKFSIQYWIGVAFIIFGIFITTSVTKI